MMAPLSKITLYILKNNCTKFGAFVCFIHIFSKFKTKQLGYEDLLLKALPLATTNAAKKAVCIASK